MVGEIMSHTEESAQRCTRCRSVIGDGAPNACTVAPNERLAAEFGDEPRCRQCWGALACEALTRETEDLGLYKGEGDMLTELAQLRAGRAVALAMIDCWMAAPSTDTADQSDTYNLLIAIRTTLRGS